MFLSSSLQVQDNAAVPSANVLFFTASSTIGSAPSPTRGSAAFQIASIMASPTASILRTLTSSATPSPTSSQSPGSPQDGSQNTGECELLGPFAILVQAALGALALLSLVYKRWRERPQRPIKIWAFDASKQVFGSVLLHLANLVMSMFSAGEIQASVAEAAASVAGVDGEKYQPNPCSFYLLNLAIDTTVGIPILIIILRLLHAAASFTPLANPPESIQSGNYGTPPRATWWLKQSMIYFIGLLGMKTCVFIVFELLPWIVQVGDWALRWTEGNEAIQIAFVMLIFPLIMNALQYYIIDSFIKNNKTTEDIEDHHPVGEDGALLAEDEIEEEEARKEDAVIASGENKATNPRAHSFGGRQNGDEDTAKASSSGGASNVEEEALTGKPA
jgi:STIMATE family